MKDEIRWVALHLYGMLVVGGAIVIAVTFGVGLAKYVKWLWSVL
jgi:hypothetical protein